MPKWLKKSFEPALEKQKPTEIILDQIQKPEIPRVNPKLSSERPSKVDEPYTKKVVTKIEKSIQ